MSKRRFSTFSLAQQYGLVGKPLSQQLSKAMEASLIQYSNLRQFREQTVVFRIPQDYSDLITLAETIARIHDDLAVLETANEHKRALCNLRQSLLILFISDSISITEKFVVELPNATVDRYRFDT